MFAHRGGSLTHAPKAVWSNSGAVRSVGVKHHGKCVLAPPLCAGNEEQEGGEREGMAAFLVLCFPQGCVE